MQDIEVKIKDGATEWGRRNVRWVSADRQGEYTGWEVPAGGDAEAVVAECVDELLGQCADNDDRKEILSGCIEVYSGARFLDPRDHVPEAARDAALSPEAVNLRLSAAAADDFELATDEDGKAWVAVLPLAGGAAVLWEASDGTRREREFHPNTPEGDAAYRAWALGDLAGLAFEALESESGE